MKRRWLLAWNLLVVALISTIGGCNYPWGSRSEIKARFEKDFAAQIEVLRNQTGRVSLKDPPPPGQEALFSSPDILWAAGHHIILKQGPLDYVESEWYGFGAVKSGVLKDLRGREIPYYAYVGECVHPGGTYELGVRRSYFRK